MRALLSPLIIKNTLCAAERPLGRARRLGALLHWGRSGGALGLERLATVLAVGGLSGSDLGLVQYACTSVTRAARVA
jgi:hypothetical protein